MNTLYVAKMKDFKIEECEIEVKEIVGESVYFECMDKNVIPNRNIIHMDCLNSYSTYIYPHAVSFEKGKAMTYLIGGLLRECKERGVWIDKTIEALEEHGIVKGE